MSKAHTNRRRGQALVELALIAPLLFVTLAAIVTLGIGVFYQQQIANAAREAARYAAIHSETSQCPTVSNLEPRENALPPEVPDFDCDPPHLRWPQMTGHARELVFGLNESGVHIAACWSGFWAEPRENNPNAYDAAPVTDDGTAANLFRDCHIGGIDPRSNSGAIPCPPPLTSVTDDEASSVAHSAVPTANQVTVYACYVWTPPFLGEVLGSSITLRAVSTEAMQHQQ
jgi:TadE-like protein